MKIFSEIFVLYDDVGLPDVEKFFPGIWASDSFDSDGDYYFYGVGDHWTKLQLSKRSPEGLKSEFRLDIYKEIREFDSAIPDVAELIRFVGYKNKIHRSFLWVAEAGYKSRPPQWK